MTLKRQKAEKENLAVQDIDSTDRPESALVTLRTAARDAGISESTLRRLVHEGVVQSVRRGGALHVTQATIVELRTGARKRGPSIGVRVQEQARGSTAAACFKRFREGESLAVIVEALEVDPAVVEGLWYKWKHLHEIETKGPARCMLEQHGGIECNGMPISQTALCGAHAARVRVLSNEEEVTLRAIRTGERIVTAVCCLSCGNMTDRSICMDCLSNEAVAAIENEQVTVRVGERIIKIISRDEMKRLGFQPIEMEAPPPRIEQLVVEPPSDLETGAIHSLLDEIRERARG